MSVTRRPNETFAEFHARICPIVVTFKRTFKKGALAGLTIEDSLRFANVGEAVSWIDDVSDHGEIHSVMLPAGVQV